MTIESSSLEASDEIIGRMSLKNHRKQIKKLSDTQLLVSLYLPMDDDLLENYIDEVRQRFPEELEKAIEEHDKFARVQD
jgi:hypothetical protein